MEHPQVAGTTPPAVVSLSSSSRAFVFFFRLPFPLSVGSLRQGRRETLTGVGWVSKMGMWQSVCVCNREERVSMNEHVYDEGIISDGGGHCCYVVVYIQTPHTKTREFQHYLLLRTPTFNTSLTHIHT